MPSALVGNRVVASSLALGCRIGSKQAFCTKPKLGLGRPIHYGGYSMAKQERPRESGAPHARRPAFALQPRGRATVAAATSREGEGEENGIGFGLRPAVEGLGEGDDIQLQCDESGCVIVMNGSSGGMLKAEDAAEELVCDLSGCYFTEGRRGENEFKLVEGLGWRIGYETAPQSEESFCAMVGAGGWSIALTANEYNDVCNLLQGLKKSIATMDQEGVTGRDDIIMEVERGSVWMECSVPKKRLAALQRFWKAGNGAEVSAFEVRFVLSGTSGRRQAEGYWPAEAVMDMLKTVDESNRKTKESTMVGASV